MKAPNITPGEWTVAAESGQWWVTDEHYVELPASEANARFLAASKRMAEALMANLDAGMDVADFAKKYGFFPDYLPKFTRKSLLAAGYTEG